MEEKVGQLLIVHFNGIEVNSDARVLVQELKVGGIIYYNWANGLESVGQVAALSQGLQKLAPGAIPLFISVDQEGGAVSRLTQGGFTHFPGNGALGYIGDEALVFEASYAMASELRSVGINLNFAPVVDLQNSIMGLRSFGSSLESVIPYAAATLAGFKKAGLWCVLKHFPGHGAVSTDSHEGQPIVHKSLAAWEKEDYLPFKMLVDQADMVMTGHILHPSLDPDRCATFSSKQLSFLRSTPFEGIIITDALNMEGVGDMSLEQAAIEAINAGCDILLLGGKRLHGNSAFEITVRGVKKIHRALLKAVKKGVISPQRLDEAFGRIMRLKAQLAPFSEEFSREKHVTLAKTIAKKALKITQTEAFTIGAHTMIVKDELPSIDKVKGADLIIFCGTNLEKNSKRALFLQKIGELNKKVVLVLDSPLKTIPISAPLVCITHSSCPFSTEAALEEIERRGKIAFSESQIEVFAQKIFENECGGDASYLVHWNEGEEFPSLGIGHWIWYPEGARGIFTESFPELIHFMKSLGVQVPSLLEGACPWATRAVFLDMPEEAKESVRQFLLKTQKEQALFLAKGMEGLLPQLLEGLSWEQRRDLCHHFFALMQSPEGIFALFDYSHFKGVGNNPLESYQGQGWGLRQVLLDMPPESEKPLQDFVASATHILEQRVSHAPVERYEARWLPGWRNRIAKYVE